MSSAKVGGDSLEGQLGLHHGFDTIIHVLHQVLLTSAKSALVRDVEDTVRGVRVLAMAATDLHIELVSDALETWPVLGKFGQVDVDRGTQGCSQVRGARSDVAHMTVVEELSTSFDGCGSTRQTLENLTDVGAGLHGDDSELVLLVDPDEERLGIVVENATSFGPVAVQAASLEEAVALLEQEVIVDKLFLITL